MIETTTLMDNLNEVKMFEKAVKVLKRNEMKIIEKINKKQKFDKSNRVEVEELARFIDGSLVDEFKVMTPIGGYILDVSKGYLSAKNRHVRNTLITNRINNLTTARKAMIRFHDFFTLVVKFLRRIRLEAALGKENCEMIANWAWQLIEIDENQQKSAMKLNFSKAPIATVFRAKSVRKLFESRGGNTAKIRAQQRLLKNVMGFGMLAVVQMLKDEIMSMKHQNGSQFFWKTPIRKILKQIKWEFKKTYKLKRTNIDSSELMTKIEFRFVRLKIRPIYRHLIKPSAEVEEKYRKINAVLKALIDEKDEAFMDRFAILRKLNRFLVEQFNEKRESFENIRIYKCDVENFFGSIQHRLLIEIIDRWIDNRKLQILTGWAINENRKNYRFCQASISPEDVFEKFHQTVRRKNQTILNYDAVEILDRSKLLHRLQEVFDSFRVKIGRHLFRINSGVPQGHTLSSRLSFIYMKDFEMKNWSKILETNCNLWYGRYVDDMIFCSDNRLLVFEMQKSLFIESNEHGIRGKPDKNGESTEDDGLIWCGIRIFPQSMTFQMKTDKKRFRSIRFRETIRPRVERNQV